MERLISWESDRDVDKDAVYRQIVISEIITVTTNSITTLANLERDLQQAILHQEDAQKTVDEIKAKITEVKRSLDI